MYDAARAAAEAIDYRGVGTVEFLFDEAGDRFFFLEMNTRLQVEHPVTEAITGLDLVELQVLAAEGGLGSARAIHHDPDAVRGHAIEVRVYAEDPDADYQPQSGVLTRFEIPVEDGIRVDTGYATGSTVSTHYDAMLAKVIAHAPTRRQAARKLAGVLSRARIHGLTTNRDLLVAILRDEGFLDEEVSTAFLAGEGVSRLGAGALAPRPRGGVAPRPAGCRGWRRRSRWRSARAQRARSSRGSRWGGATSRRSRRSRASRATSRSRGTAAATATASTGTPSSGSRQARPPGRR